MEWKNRIVGTADVDPNSIELHPLNFRLHPAHQKAAIQGSLDTLGWIAPILVNRTTGHILDGHARAKMARDAGEPTVPITYVELTEAEEAQALLSLDPISAMAETDKNNLELLIGMVQSSDNNVIEFITSLMDESEEKVDIKEEEIKAYKKIHVLLSYLPEDHEIINKILHDLPQNKCEISKSAN